MRHPDGSNLAVALMLMLQFEKAEFRTIAEARAALEPMMAQLAAERMTDDQLADLTGSVRTMASNLDDQTIFLAENKKFHDLIAHGSGNAMFGVLVDALIGILDGSAIGIDYPHKRREAVLAAHERICRALCARDPDSSAETMRRHITEYLKYAERKFPEVLSAPVTWASLE